MSDAARTIRSARQRWAAPKSPHDRMITILRTVLPMSIGVLAAFLVMAPLTMGGDVSFLLDKNKVEVAQERLKIERAQYRGEDDQGRVFEIDAGSAVQKSSAEPIVQLNGLSAGIVLKDGPARLSANSGRYDIDKQRVAVDGPIEFRTSDGYTLNTRDATIDLKTRQLQSGGAVEGKTPMGQFSGDRMSADLENRTVRLSGNARLRIVPRRTK